MKYILICVVLLVVPLLADKKENLKITVDTEDNDEDDAGIPDDEAYGKFLLKHGKKYHNSIEKLFRLEIFSKNRKKINDHNKNKNVNFKLKMNKRGDLTEDEFSQKYKGLTRDSPPKDTFTPPQILSKRQTNTIFDYRAKGVVTRIQDQGDCGSCYAFSSIGAIESHLALAGAGLYKLSEQQVVDCTYKKGNYGCNGGRPQTVFNYIKDIGGINPAQIYPNYSNETLQPGNCAYVAASKSKAKVIESINVTPGEDNLKAALTLYGPIAVNIDAHNDTFNFYASGVYDEPTCRNGYYNLDHSVLLIGYGTDNNSIDYWIVKNSWGTDWGTNGFIKMIRNKNNLCGIATDPSYPKVSIQ